MVSMAIPMPRPMNARPVLWMLKPWMTPKVQGHAWKARCRIPRNSEDVLAHTPMNGPPQTARRANVPQVEQGAHAIHEEHFYGVRVSARWGPDWESNGRKGRLLLTAIICSSVSEYLPCSA